MSKKSTNFLLFPYNTSGITIQSLETALKGRNKTLFSLKHDLNIIIENKPFRWKSQRYICQTNEKQNRAVQNVERINETLSKSINKRRNEISTFQWQEGACDANDRTKHNCNVRRTCMLSTLTKKTRKKFTFLVLFLKETDVQIFRRSQLGQLLRNRKHKGLYEIKEQKRHTKKALTWNVP